MAASCTCVEHALYMCVCVCCVLFIVLLKVDAAVAAEGLL